MHMLQVIVVSLITVMLLLYALEISTCKSIAILVLL